MKDKVLTIRLNERTCQLLEELKQDTGSYTTADVIRQAIFSFYGKYHKEYMPKSDIGASTYTGKVKETKVSKELQEKYDICAMLGGNVVDKGGVKSCEYKIYELINPTLVDSYDQTIPFSMLTKDTLRTQYSPNKEACEEVINLKD